MHRAILAARHALYEGSREIISHRWARHTRNWKPSESVTVDLEREAVVADELAYRATGHLPA